MEYPLWLSQGVFFIPSHLKKTIISKPLLLVVFLCALFFVLGNNIPAVYAANDDVPTEKNTKLSEAFQTGQYGEFKLDTKYYEIDSVSDADAKKLDNGIWEDIKDTLLGWADVGGKITDKFNYALNSMVNILFQFNIFMTKVMIICLDFGYDFNIVDKLIDELGNVMPGITGIKSGGLIGGGLFGNLMKFIVLLTALYTLYVYVVKRAFIASMGVILKTVLLLTISFLVFSNYSSFLKTANGLSGEISSYIVASPSSNDMSKGGNSTLNSMKDTLWSMFVDRPYLYLQYGEHDIDKIGRDRIATLMKMKPGEDRYDYVLQNEVGAKGNTLMINSSVTEKVAFTPFYLIINGFVSIPIYLLSIMLVMLQFWFVIIAAIAPFALLVGVIPGFNGVTKRYFVELTIPLALKVFFSFFTLFILVLSEVLYRLDFNRTNDITSYVGIGILEFILFITLFLLRKRIKDIFISGSQIISGLRDATGTFTAPIKQATQTTATLAGAAVGGAIAGPQGAMMGANLGSTAGRVVTGEAGATEIATTTAKVAYLSQLKGNGKNMDVVPNQLDDNKKKMVTDFLQEKGFDDETIDDTISQFEKSDVSDVNEVELNEQFDKLAENAKDEGLEKDFATDFVRGIKDSRATNKMQSQLKTLTGNEVPGNEIPVERSTTSENAARFFLDKGLGTNTPETMGNIVDTLESKGLNDVSLQEMETQYHKLEQQYQDGNLDTEFEKSFTQGIINDRKNADIHKRNDQVFGNPVNITPVGPEQLNESTPIPPIGTEQPNETMNKPLRNNNQDANLYSLDNVSTMKSNSLEGSNAQSNDMTVKPIDSNSLNTSMQSGPINNTSMENGSLGNTPINNGSMDVSTMNNSSMTNTPMEGSSVNNASAKGNPIGATSVESTSMNGSPMGGSSMEGSSMNNSTMGGSPMGTTSIEGNSMNGSKMGSTPLSNDSMQGSGIDSKPMENGNSMNSAPIQGSSSNNSINRVRDTHRQQAYANVQKSWKENQNNVGSIESNVENNENQ